MLRTQLLYSLSKYSSRNLAHSSQIRLIHSPSNESSSSTPLKRYYELVGSGKLRQDPGQERAMKYLEDIFQKLQGYEAKIPSTSEPQKSFNFFGLFSGKEAAPQPSNFPKGLYVYGDVGSGKTMLMDVFFSCLQTQFKKRVHFHTFMLDVHQRIHEWRKTEQTRANYDPIPPLARQLAKEAWILCFDEFQVTDVADAMILKRLFSELYSYGVVTIATSNRVPDDLYLGGIQRKSFLPFIETLKERNTVHCISSHTDYRLTGRKIPKIYLLKDSIKDPKPTFVLNEYFKLLTQDDEIKPAPTNLNVLGHELHVPMSSIPTAAIFSYHDLCEKAFGAIDFSKLSQTYHTIFLSDIPRLQLRNNVQARRFIILIDELYNQRAKLLCSAEVEPEELFPKEICVEGAREALQKAHEDLSTSSFQVSMYTPSTPPPPPSTDLYDNMSIFTGEEEVFMFHRAVSRLTEMQTEAYLSAPHLYFDERTEAHRKFQRFLDTLSTREIIYKE